MLSRDSDTEPSGPVVRMLGPFAAFHAGDPLNLGPRKSQALLAYLTRRSGMAAPRETIIGLLWADSDEERARASLRQALSGLRRALRVTGAVVIDADLTMISLQKDVVRTDVDTFLDRSSSDDATALQSAADLYIGDFLEGFPAVSPEFDRWLDMERGALRARCTTMLLRLCDMAAAGGRNEQMIATAQRLLQMDPLQEHVHRRLMRAYLAQGRHDAALKQFETIQTLLSAELGVAPEQPTLELASEIRRKRSGRRTAPEADRAVELHAAPRPMPPSRPSIAVLPFRNLSPESDTIYLGEGIAEDIIVELGREAGLMVVSRGSSFRFSLEEQDLTEIGRLLGVRFLLSGSIRVFGQKFRLTAHLSNCLNGQDVWAERFDRDLDDILDLQSEVARLVTGTVVGRISRGDAEAARARPVESLEAYALVMRGLGHIHAQSLPELNLGIACFERAVALDATYGRAFGLLALSQIYRQWNYNMSTDVSDFLPLAERSISLDHRDAKGHCAMGLGLMLQGNFDRAGYHFETGLRMNPNDNHLLIEYGRYLMYMDRPEEGLTRIREAMRLDPYHPNWFWNIQGRCLHTLGRHQEALAAFLYHDNPPFYVLAYIAACHRKLGNDADADAAQAEMRRLRPDFEIERFKAVFPYRNEETKRRFMESLFG